MVGNPYTIAGRTYYPSEKRYAATGLASWYGDAFHGRRTANGEIYDRDAISAAHPTMPLPSYARVTNLRNHYSMIVRVNDRGPFTNDRVMDVSRKTAEVLGFNAKGTTPVRVEYVGGAELSGSDDLTLLATLRSDGPASLSRAVARDWSAPAGKAPSAVASAGSKQVILAEDSEGMKAEEGPAAHRHSSAAAVPLPPRRPLGLGKAARAAGSSLALR
jgi:rare lipoprotein A